MANKRTPADSARSQKARSTPGNSQNSQTQPDKLSPRPKSRADVADEHGRFEE